MYRTQKQNSRLKEVARHPVNIPTDQGFRKVESYQKSQKKVIPRLVGVAVVEPNVMFLDG